MRKFESESAMDGEKSLRSKSVVILTGWRKAGERTIRMPSLIRRAT